MPLYQYLVKNSDGNDIKGVQEADSIQELIGVFKSKGWIVIDVKPAKNSAAVSRLQVKKKKKKIKIDDIVIFTRQLATMIDSGVPVVQALDILAEQMDNYAFKEIIEDVYNGVEGGANFSDSLEKHKKVFSTLYVSMVRAGEISGELNTILDRLATYLEKSAALRKKVKAALVYPIAVTLIAMGITIFMMTFVIPKFAEIFTSLGAPLPAPTMILILISDFVKTNIITVSIVLFVVGIGFKKYISTERGRIWFHKRLLKLPLFGPLFMKVAMSKFSRTLSTLLKSGVPILSAFDIVSKTVGNRLIELAVEDVKNALEAGHGISETLIKKNVFPPMVVRMIGIGEETGEIEKMLGKIADFYDEQVDVAISGLTSLIEPLIIVFLGGVIGTIVVCMFLPIFTITQAIK